MKMLTGMTSLALLMTSFSVKAVTDLNCEPLIKANEAVANAPSWEKVVTGPDKFKMETRKIENQYYSRINGADWLKQPPNFDATVKNFAKELREGKIKLTQCINEGKETINDVGTSVISFHIQMEGMPISKGKVYIGIEDGLPYAETSDNMQTSYKYKNIEAPIR